MKKITTAVALLSAMSVAGVANAQEGGSGFYAGASFGYVNTDIEVLDEIQQLGYKKDEDSTAYKVVAGYSINESYGVEAFYLDGAKLDVDHGTSPIKGDLKLSAFGVAGVLKTSVAENVGVYGKLGAAQLKSKINLSTQGLNVDGSDSETGALLGLGVEYKMEAISLKGEYEVITKGGDNIHFISAGVSYHF